MPLVAKLGRKFAEGLFSDLIAAGDYSIGLEGECKPFWECFFSLLFRGLVKLVGNLGRHCNQ